MRRNRFSLALGAILLLAGGDAAAQDSGDPVPAGECCLTLLVPMGARGIAIGQALAARAGSEAVFANPGALMDIDDDAFYVHRSSLGEAQVNTFSLFIHSRLAGVFGLTYRLIDFGDQESTGGSGEPLGTLTLLDQMLVASFSTRVSSSLNAGVSYKLYDFRQQCSGACGEFAFSATTHMLDAGAQYKSPRFKHFVAGASLTSFGVALQVKNAAQADPTPARLRLGAGYELGHHLQKDTTIQAWLYSDIVQRLHDPGTPAINLGAEVILNETIFVRAGHASESNGTTSGGTGLGIALKYERFHIGVGKSFTTSELDPEGEPVHISFGVTF